MSIASLMLDLQGTVLSAEEKELLDHPMAGGVILFTRNYESVDQLEELIRQIRKSAKQDVLIAVDHEGGRVQRFREEFTSLPALAKLYESSDDEQTFLQMSHHHGWLMASELRASDIDFSFAPVLDLNYGVSEVIGDRSFHRQPDLVAALAVPYIEGMREAGMASTGKHFPGHGAVVADSHVDIPKDDRTFDEIWAQDIMPFAQLMRRGLDAIMPAHVIYSEVDSNPAGFSRIWLQDILRGKLVFDGVIFSDDLSMEGASVVGGFAERAEAATEAGCDMILVCNNRQGVIDVIDKANIKQSDESIQRLNRMKGQPFMNRSALLDTKQWSEAVDSITAIV
ncbi:MAG TPA: beta-N-acetylhexosaminidase [Leucothrix mucor]|nr:beta-N-acetylhexosaminidase [Leucothrix mucor]